MPLELKYFILKPKGKNNKDPFALASQSALHAYADAIEDTDAQLAIELRQWANKETAMMGQTVKTGD